MTSALRVLVASSTLLCFACGSSYRFAARTPVAVEMQADRPQVTLQSDGDRWTDVCASPCRTTVVTGTYRIAGRNVQPSDPFPIRAPSKIGVRAGYRDTRITGIVFLTIGIPLLALGSFALLFGDGVRTSGGRSPSWGGVALFGGTGLALTTGAIVMIAASSTTVSITF